MKKLLLLIVLFVSAISFSQTPELADEYWDKAEKAVEIKDWENAALFYEKSVEAVKKCETPRLRDLMASLNNSAFYYKKVNDYDKSLNLYYEGLEVVEELISAKHPNYAKCKASA